MPVLGYAAESEPTTSGCEARLIRRRLYFGGESRYNDRRTDRRRGRSGYPVTYENIGRAAFLDRVNRFVARVRLDGRIESVHVKNTGRLAELLKPGAEVWLTAPGTPGRKTKYDLVAVRKEDGVLFNIDSQAANRAAAEWLAGQDFDRVIPEYRYGDSRLDFYMERSGVRFLLEIKGCTLERDGIGYFPDAPTERGVKHLRELERAAREGWQAALGFVIQMDGVTEVRPNRETHPAFGAALEAAEQAGVRIFFLCCHVEPDRLTVAEVREKNAEI
ncbi:MAG: DNA/RNA nuclease SfsA [Oscillospiraceae bacterium]|nr:DNA/RNA nuclease SfsA [Oscillospiraceae bacterium]